MIQRLIVPLAFRSFLLSIAVAGIVCMFVAPVRLLRGDQAMSATLREMSAGVSWTGSAVSSSAVFDPASCQKSKTCDVFTLKVDISDEYRMLHPGLAVSIRLTWENPENDFDLYLGQDGRMIDDSSEGQTESEEVRISQPANGIYHIFAHAAAVAPSTIYNGQVGIILSPEKPLSRAAKYQKDPDGRFGPEMFQFAPELTLDDGQATAEARPHIAVDPFNNIYVAADGSDFGLTESGLGLGKPYFREPHRPAAASGSSMGNTITGRNRMVFTVFSGASGNEIYLAGCAEPCERPAAKRVFGSSGRVTFDHPYPVVAEDRAGGLHVAFSDGRNVFLVSSADGGQTWRQPARVNDDTDPETTTAVSPWVFAGDSGRIGITWQSAAGGVYYAVTSDAFAPFPTFSYVYVGDPQPAASLTSAAVDPFGNANIVYGQTRVLRQLAGERLFFGPYMTAAGVLKTDTGTKHISFNVRHDLSGNLTYLDDDRRLSLECAHFTSTRRADQNISATGHGRLQDGTDVTFTLVTSDPGSNKQDFSISMSNGYFAAGTLQAAPSPAVRVQKADRRTE